MRTFLALEIPPNIKLKMAAIQKGLQQEKIIGRWTKLENLHLTLVFFGNLKPDFQKIKKIKPVDFKLQFLKLEAFPSIKKAKIIYLKLDGDLPELERIRNQFIEEKRPFVAHLTLARLKKPQNLGQVFTQIKIPKIKFTANQISLFSSTLTPSGPIYKKI